MNNKKIFRRTLAAVLATSAAISGAGCGANNNNAKQIAEQEALINKIKSKMSETELSGDENEYSDEWYKNCEELAVKAYKDNNFRLLETLIEYELSHRPSNTPEWIENNEGMVIDECNTLFDLLQDLDRYYYDHEGVEIDDCQIICREPNIKGNILEILKVRLCSVD